MKTSRDVPKLENFTPYTPSPSTCAQTCDDVPEELSRRQLITSWVCRFIAAGIMIETLFFKFTGAPESVYIFSKLGMEPWWRYGQGVWELIASILLLTPRYGWAGSLLTLGAIGAAIVSHITILGIKIQGDGGLLFAMALLVFASAFVVTFIHRHAIPNYRSMSQW